MWEGIFTLDSLISLFTLTLLEIVLGIDNVIFVSILIGRLPASQNKKARRLWMILGILVRSALLMGLGWLVANGMKPLMGLGFDDALNPNHANATGFWGFGQQAAFFRYKFNLRNLIMLAGGFFLLYKTVKEIHQKLEGEEEHLEPGSKKSGAGFGAIMTQIVLVDMVFSFDSIITAIGMAQKVPVMIAAVMVAMGIMFFFADGISRFIEQHPTFKILALSFLIMVGFSLFYEGLEPVHESHIPKGYIYVAMAFSFLVELLNLRLSKNKERKAIQLRGPRADMENKQDVRVEKPEL